ncbi:MAG: hemolysin family protein [Planctomycetota bacterium]
MNDTWNWVLLGALLLCSGVISASETALFSLGRRDARRAGLVAQRLLDQPRDLLVSVLFANLVVNILYFSFADRLQRGSDMDASLSVLLALVPLLIVGEVLPKTIGLRAPVPIARTFARPMLVIVRALLPIRSTLVTSLEFVGRLVGTRDERHLSSDELAHVLGDASEKGALHEVEADFLSEVVELRGIRVREIMTPRVDAIWLEVDGSNRDQAVQEALSDRVQWLPVVEGGPDAVVGMAKLRDLLLHKDREISSIVMPVAFVPEVASALDLLRFLRERRASEAVAVDEWGGSAGVVNLEEVFEEIVGDLRVEGEAREDRIVPLGEGRFRVPGGVSVRDWNEFFGQRVLPVEFETVGGLVTALLGRVPRAGDEVRIGGLELEVNEVRGRRVLSVDVGATRGAS